MRSGVTAIVDALEELTPEWFTAALREGGTLQNGASVTSVEARFIGTGQLGAVVLAQLEYGEGRANGPSSLIVKLPSRDAGSRQLGVAMGAYVSEVRFYAQIAPLLDVAVPRVHWSAVEPETGRFTLLLDDLSPVSVAGDMVGGATIEQAALAIAELPKLQAPVWDSPVLREDAWWGDHARTEMLFGSMEPALPLFIERFADQIEPEHLALAQRLVPKAGVATTATWKPPFVLAHGDYRLDNMMFATGDGEPPLTVIDWQAARLGPPLLDAAIFLGSCVDTEDRRAHERDLLRAYHESLVAAGVRDFSLEDCSQSYRVGSLYPLLLGIGASVMLERTERGDRMWSRMIRGCADLVLDLDADRLID
jgi:aminoglycoside/choline kinase family phosphotransferase